MVTFGGQMETLALNYSPINNPKVCSNKEVTGCGSEWTVFWRLLRYLSCPQAFSRVTKVCSSILLELSASQLSEKVQLGRHADSSVLSGLWKELFGHCAHKWSQLESRWWPSEIDWSVSLSKDWQFAKGDIKSEQRENHSWCFIFKIYIQNIFRILHQRGKNKNGTKYESWDACRLLLPTAFEKSGSSYNCQSLSWLSLIL